MNKKKKTRTFDGKRYNLYDQEANSQPGYPESEKFKNYVKDQVKDLKKILGYKKVRVVHEEKNGKKTGRYWFYVRKTK